MLYQTLWQFTTVEMVGQILYGSLTALLLLFGFELLSRYLKADKKTRQDASYETFFIIAMALIGYSLYNIPALMQYFYAAEGQEWIKLLQQLFTCVILVPFGVMAEKILFKHKLKFSVFLITGGIVFLYLLILFFMELANPASVSTSATLWLAYAAFGVFAILGLWGFVQILIVKLSPQKDIKNKIIMGLVFGALALGSSAIGGMFRETPPLHTTSVFYVIFRLINLFCWIMLRYYFISIPSYSEIEWKSGMVDLHVIQSDMGLSLYSYQFTSSTGLKGDIEVTMTIPEEELKRNVDSDLISGGLVGIRGMLAEIAGDKGNLQNIQIGEKTLCFKSGKAVMCLLLCKENLGVYHIMMQELAEAIEAKYPKLIEFDGNLKGIDIKSIVEEVLGFELPETPKKEDN